MAPDTSEVCGAAGLDRGGRDGGHRRGDREDQGDDRLRALRPGDRLPKESELAAELGLSRNSLREAVRALSLIRILDVRQGDGTYVTSLDPQLLLEALSFVVDFHRDDTVLEFLAVRRILEPVATGMAAARIAEEELDALRASWTRSGDAPSVEELVAADLEFHRGSRGDGQLGAVLPARRPVRPDDAGPGVAGADPGGRGGADAARARAILAALRDRDSEAARAWATVHIASVEQWLRSTL